MTSILNGGVLGKAIEQMFWALLWALTGDNVTSLPRIS